MSKLIAKDKGYLEFVALKRAMLNKSDLDNVREWVEKRIEAMPEMTVEEYPLTGTDEWKEKRTEDNKDVDLVTGAFFKLEGRKVHTSQNVEYAEHVWHQPGIIQNAISLTIPTPEGDITLLASDLVGIIKDNEGNVLFTVGQGVFSKTYKNAKVRTPFQTSAGKAVKIMKEGKIELDPIFSETVAILGAGKSLEGMFASGEFELFPLGEADENRIDATNVGFVTKVWDQTVHKKLEMGDKNRWCAPDEVRALARAGLINGHTAAALLAA